MNKVAKQSEDIYKEKIEQLKAIYPALFSDEGNLNEDELQSFLKQFASSSEGKYEFNWAGKMSAKRNAFTTSRAMLKPDKDRSIDFDKTENLIIEGDNLEVLKLLQKSYQGKIKCIYIDPPYNTGNDFIYTDNFSDTKQAYWEKSGTTQDGVKLDTNTESQGRYHSNWLNMIYPRLLIARNLLKDDGVTFVSINDSEVYNFKKLMDEIFGEENFIANITRVSKTTSFRGNFFAPSKDYLLVYAKNIYSLSQFQDIVEEKQFKKTELDGARKGEKYRDDIAFYLSTLETRPNQRYYIVCPDGEKVVPPGKTFPPDKPIGGDGVWRWNLETYNQKKSLIVFKPSNRSPLITDNGEKAHWNIYTKSYLNDKIENGNLPRDLFTNFLNRNGSEDLKKLGIPFDFSKPSKLIRYILKIIGTSKIDIILDFFAGSGSPAQAVMELNKEDRGNRKFILVQIPEKTDENSEAYKAGYKKISDICIERVKRVAKKLSEEKATGDIGFKVFTLSPSYFPENLFTPDPEKTEEENKKALAKYIEEASTQLEFKFDEFDLMYEVLLKDGFTLNFKAEKLTEFTKNNIYKVTDGEKHAYVTLDGDLKDETLQKLQDYKGERFLCLERAIDTTKKWNLQNMFGSNLWVI